MTAVGRPGEGPQVEELKRLLAQYVEMMPALDSVQAQVAVGLWRVLAEGEPVTVAGLATRLDVPAREVAAAVDGVLASSVQRDEAGRIVAFWGLSLPALPSPHRLTVRGRTLYAWCAPDTLWLPRVLATTVTVHSALEPTGQPISLVVGPQGMRESSVDGAVVSFVRPVGTSVGETAAAIVSSFCHHQLFFRSRDAAARWAEAQGREDIAVFPVEQADRGAGEFIEAVVGPALHVG